MSKKSTQREASLGRRLKRFTASLNPSGELIKIPGTPLAKRGLPDYLWVIGGSAIWIELKSDDGKLTPKQAHTIAGLVLKGSAVVVILSPSGWQPFVEWAGTLYIVRSELRETCGVVRHYSANVEHDARLIRKLTKE